jgi:hypothetical protein
MRRISRSDNSKNFGSSIKDNITLKNFEKAPETQISRF